jgi:hypothetical protein
MPDHVMLFHVCTFDSVLSTLSLQLRLTYIYIYVLIKWFVPLISINHLNVLDWYRHL